MKRQVLIADPVTTSRVVLAKNLASWGYDVVSASDGHEASSLLQSADAPEVALLDASLPGVSVLDLCRQIRELRGDDVLVLVLVPSAAGGGEAPSELDALEAGADGVVKTPAHLRELRMRLSAGLRGRRPASAPESSEEPTSGRRTPAEPPLLHSIVGGKYRVDRMIGRGGMGTVWQGTHLALGTRVAIKFIKSEYALVPAVRARFELEARCAAHLRTKYAVQVFDYGITEDGLPYIVMEYLEGQSLQQYVEAHGPLTFAETVTFVAEVAHALSQLHTSGTIHRDVKPDNVLFVDDPDAPTNKPKRIAKVIDFGVAKVLAKADAERSGATTLCTQQGIVVGTPNYMAPEMLQGLSEPSIDADLWALATCAFMAMTGSIPFEGGTIPEVFRKVCQQPLPVPSQVAPGVPVEFDRWFARACNHDPAQRFATARDMARALAEAHTDFASAMVDLTPSLTRFVTAAPMEMPRARSFDQVTVRPAKMRLFELDPPIIISP